MGSVSGTKKIVVIGMPLSAGLISSVDSCSLLSKALRSADRTIGSDGIMQIPFVDGGEGTIDAIVSQTVGSFLEVQVTNGSNEQIIVPIGLAGEDNHLSVIESQRVCGVTREGEAGTTFGIGELIQDSLDEGAFSILVGIQEPLARDAGLGIAQALGVCFYDAEKTQLDLRKDDIARIDSVDASGRDFQLLSSRVFLAECKSEASLPNDEFGNLLKQLAKIIERDCNLQPSLEFDRLGPSAISFGMSTFLNIQQQPGFELIAQALDFSTVLSPERAASVIVFAESTEQMENDEFLRLTLAHHPNVLHILQSEKTKRTDNFISLHDAPVFQAPLRPNASQSEVRRDIAIRLEKLAPVILKTIRLEPTDATTAIS